MAEEEAWVLDTGKGALSQVVSSPTLPEAVKRLYLDDYRREWQQFIKDIVLIKDGDLTRAIEIARNISGPETPLKPFVKAVDRETTLSVPPEPEPGLVGAATGKAQDLAGKALRAIAGAPGDSLVKKLVDDHFEEIHRLAGGPGGNPPPAIDATVQQLNEFYQFLVAAKFALDAGQSPPPAESAMKLRADSARLPEPLRSMIQELAEGTARQITERVRLKQIAELRQQSEKQAEEARQARQKQAEESRLQQQKQADDIRLQQEKQQQERKLQRERQLAEVRQTRDRLDAELRAQVAEFCVRAINGRYPFVRSSATDVTAEDFARLFAPGGLLDGFFQKHLTTLVDTSHSPWQFKDVAMGSSSALAEFQRAQMIREVFFRAGGHAPSIQLEFKPIEMDSSITQFLLDVDGKLVRYAHGPQVPIRVQFPGPSGRSQVRISISPAPPSGANAVRFEGPWALFRMFDGVKIKESNQLERFVAAISIEGRSAVFEVVASSVRNPFRLPELSQFRCPTAL
jgi:type VI secretion system protein ImpL